MARQTFTKGQTVYVARHSRHNWRNWRKAVVAKPDVVHTSSGFGGGRLRRRDIHYVAIHEIDTRTGKVVADREWEVLNNCQQIVTEDRYAEIAQAENIGKLRQTIDAHRVFEVDFAKYVEQARIILEAQVTKAGLDDIDELAHYLRGMFSFRGDYNRQTRGDVRKVRADKRAEAQAAQVTLQALGVEAPELGA